MDFLIGSGPIGSYTNGSGLGLVWSGPTSEESNLIGSYRIPDQTRPDKVRSRWRSDQHVTACVATVVDTTTASRIGDAEILLVR